MLPQFLHYNNGKTGFFHLFSKINISFSKILSFSSGCGSKDSGDTLFRQAWRARSFGIRPRDVFHRVVAVRLLPEISLPGRERMGKSCPLAIIARRQGAGAWQERLPWGCQSIPNGRIRSACHVREAYMSDSKTMAVIHFREQFPERLKKEHMKRRSRFRQKAYYSFQSLRINRCSVIAVRFPYLLLAQGNYCPYWFAASLPSPAERTLWHMMSFDQPPYDFIAKGIMSSFWSFCRKSGGRWGTRTLDINGVNVAL